MVYTRPSRAQHVVSVVEHSRRPFQRAGPWPWHSAGQARVGVWSLRAGGRVRCAREGWGRRGPLDGEAERMSKRILIVDDEDDIREVAQVSLELVGQWEVVTAASGRDGIERARSAHPDAILL